MRKSWVQVNGELIPKEDYVEPVEHGVYIIPDIKPYKSMKTGEMITSRSHHKAHLKQHNLIEVGNEKLEKKQRDVPTGLKQEIIKNFRSR